MKSKRSYCDEKAKAPFPTVLKALLKERGTTPGELASHIGVTRQTVSNYCLGQTSPSFPDLCEIADFFDVSTDYLLGRTDVRSNSTELRAVCAFTGLSESAVNGLRAYSGQSTAFISKLIAQGEITRIGLLYEGLRRSIRDLEIATQLYEHGNPASSHPADVKAARDYHHAKDHAELAQWKLERSIVKLLDHMLKGEEGHGIPCNDVQIR